MPIQLQKSKKLTQLRGWRCLRYHNSTWFPWACGQTSLGCWCIPHKTAIWILKRKGWWSFRNATAAKDLSQTVQSKMERVNPPFDRRGIFESFLHLLHLVPNVLYKKGMHDCAARRYSNAKIMQQRGLQIVCQTHASQIIPRNVKSHAPGTYRETHSATGRA